MCGASRVVANINDKESREGRAQASERKKHRLHTNTDTQIDILHQHTDIFTEIKIEEWAVGGELLLILFKSTFLIIKCTFIVNQLQNIKTKMDS